jgi:hypothetical protein
VYNKVADSSDVVIQEQLFSIVDTHEPAIAMHPHAFLREESDIPSYRNQIFPEGYHQGVRRFVSHGLHHITSVSGHCGMSRDERFTSTSFGSVLLCPATFPRHQQAFRVALYWD